MKLDAKKELRKTKNRIKVDETIISKDLVELKPADNNLVTRVDNRTTFKSVRNIPTQLNVENGDFCNQNDLFGITIDTIIGSNKGVLLDDGSHKIKIIVKEQFDITGKQSSENKVTFVSFNGKDNLELIVKNNSLQMNLIIPAIREQQYSYNFGIVTENLCSSYNEDMKAIIFVDKTTKDKVFTIAKPFMIDKNDAFSSDIEMTYICENDNEYTWGLTLSKDWINSTLRQFPIVMSPRIEINDQPVISLTNYIDSRKFISNSDELVLGIKNYKSYSIIASIAIEKIISELIRTEMKKYSVSLELHYEYGIRIDNSKGIVVFCGSELISENLLKSTENNILVNITEIIKKEMQKYKAGMKISNLSIEFLYGNKNNVIGSCVSTGTVGSNYIKDDYVIVKDRSFAESLLRPEIHLDGVRGGEVVPGTPFLEYDSDRAGTSSLNLFNSELSHKLELGSVAAKAFKIGVKLLYDTRFLKDQIKNGLKNVFGKGWLLNVSQRLVKNDNYSKLLGCKDMIYYDGDNNPHILNEKWYYEKDGVRYYIQKDLVFIGNDQKLKYRNAEDEVFDVEYEASNDDGLTLISTNSKMNYIKKSDLKVHNRYFIKLANKRIEVFKDENGLLEVPHFYKDTIKLSESQIPEWMNVSILSFVDIYAQTFVKYQNVSLKDGSYINDEAGDVLQCIFFKRQLINKNGKYFVRGLTARYKASTDDYYENHEEDGTDIEIEVEKELYVYKNIPLADYYENEDITNINSQISQYELKIRSLKQQTESTSKSVFRIENEIDHQNYMHLLNAHINQARDDVTKKSYEKNDKIDETYINLVQKQTDLSDDYSEENYNYQIKSLKSQLFDQQKSLQEAFNTLAQYESRLSNLKERKEALVKEQKEGVQDYIMDTSGNVLGFDYFGKLVYLSDKYENEIAIIYDDNRITEISSKNQKMILHYNDNKVLDYIIDAQGRRKTFEIKNDLLQSVLFVAEYNEKQKIVFEYNNEKLTSIKSPSGMKTSFSWNSNFIERVIQSSDIDSISTESVTRKSEEKISDETITETNYGVQVKNNINEDIISYRFDNIGRLAVLMKKDSINNEVEYTHTCFDEKKKLFKINYKQKNEINRLNFEVGKTIELIIGGTEGDNIIPLNCIPTNGLAFVRLSIPTSFDSSVEFTLEAVVIDKAGKERIYRQVFDEYRYVGLPFVLKASDKKVMISLSSTEKISLKGNLFECEGSIFEYDENENLIHEISGLEETFYKDFIDGRPTVITTKDKFGVERTSYQSFDALGRVIFTEDYDHNCKEIFYDEKGNIIEERSYNKESPTLAKITKATYDENGNVTKIDGVMRDENGNYPQESCTYLPNSSKVSSQKSSGGQTICYGYDFNTDDVLEISSDAMGQGNNTMMKYRFGLLTSLTHHGFSIDYVLDHKGRKIAINVGKNKLVSIEYEDNCEVDGIKHCNAVTKITADDCKCTTYKDKKGRLLETKLSSGDKIIYSYDDEDRLISVEGCDEVSKTVYAKKSSIESNLNINKALKVSEIYSYNDHDSLIKIERDISFKDKLLDSASNEFIYDSKHEDRIVRETTNLGTIFDINYDALGRITNKTLTYKDKVLLEDQFEYLQYGENSLDLINEHVVKVDNEVLDVAHYKYDVSGNIILEERDEFTTRYAYDKLNRLIREDNPQLNKTFVYKYDNGGNIIQKKEYSYSLTNDLTSGEVTNYTYSSKGWKDQLIRFKDKKIVYDIMGRPISIGKDSLKWDYRGRMTQYGDNTFAYNLSGVRDSKNDIRFALSGNKILAEINLEGQITIKYLYALEKLIGFEYNNKRYFYERNIQGDILKIYQISDESSVLVAEYIYDAWGNHKVINHTSENIGDVNPFRYRGYYFDSETGLYYLNSRYYSPEMGRFISPDEFSILDETKAQINGLNLYMYCGDNPIMRVDPSGMEWWEFWKWDWGKIFLIGAVVAGAIVVGVMTGGAAFAALGGAYVGVAIATGVAAAVGWVAFCGLLANAVSYIDTEIYVLLNYNSLELNDDEIGEFRVAYENKSGTESTIGWSREKKLKYIKYLRQNGKNENWSVGQMLREFEYHDGAYNFLTSFGLDQSNIYVHRAMHVDFEENQTFYTYILRGIGNFIF